MSRSVSIDALDIPAGKKKIISVNRQAMARGEAGISVKCGGETFACYDVMIAGPSVVRHDPEKKRQPRAYVVTKARLILTFGPMPIPT